MRPGHQYRIDAELSSTVAQVVEADLNAYGLFDALRKWTGVRMDDPEARRDRALTTVWIISMDALAIGLLIVVLSGLYLGPMDQPPA